MLGELLGNLLELFGMVPGNSGDSLGKARSGPGLSWMPLVTSGAPLGVGLGAFGSVLRSLWRDLRGLCGDLGVFCSGLRTSRAQGRSWPVLGRSWVALGRSWGALSGALLAAHKQRPFSSGP